CGGQRCGGFAGPREPSLADAGSLDDPLVGGLDDRLEIGVGDDSLGQGRGHRGDAGESTSRHREPPSSHTSGWPGCTGSPSRTSTPATRASNGLITSIVTDPCSTTATACPAATHSSPSWNRAGGRCRRRPAAGETTRKKPNPPVDSPTPWGLLSDERGRGWLCTLTVSP